MEKYRVKKVWLTVVVLLCLAALIKIASLFPQAIEKYYYAGFYKYESIIFRKIFGWLPFSFGDLLYTAVAVWLLIKIIKAIAALFKKRITKSSFLFGFGKTVKLILIVYIIFNIFWGLNYNRVGIAAQLGLQPGNYNDSELKQLTAALRKKLNTARNALRDTVVYYPSNQQITATAVTAYHNAEIKYPFLKYRTISVKPSLYSWAGNYLGFLGYYNPFTGEAQLNTLPPPFARPYITCHEMAHQLGYGSEDEANFAGYLAATSSQDKYMQYAVYFDLFIYANGELFVRDSLASRANYKQLDTLVKKDYITYRNYFLAHRSPVEKIINIFYGQYLKANNQPKGLQTYSDVVAWLIAYQKKYKVL